MTSSARYRFEFRVLKWAEGFTRMMCGERRSMFLGFRSDGSVRRVYLTPTATGWTPEKRAELIATHGSWLFYTPYEEGGTGYLEWSAVAQEVLERFLDKRFEATDFVDVRTTSVRDRWPDTWQVIVAS
jgi:hypothetical protein